MEHQPHSTKVNQRVRLKTDGQDGLYIYAAAGAPGWVRKQDHDSLGYPTVFIEWDKNHWSYNGEPDRWTMEAHFEPEESTVPVPDGPFDPAMMERFAAFLEFEKHNREQEGQPEPGPVPDEPSLDKQYEVAAEKAFETMIGADSFILVAVSNINDRELAPKTTSFYKTAESGLVAEMYVAKLAAIATEELVINEVSRIVTDKQDTPK